MKYFLVLLAAFGVIFLVRGCDGEIRDFDFTQYEKATVVGTLVGSKDIINTTTSTGVNVAIYLVSNDSACLKFQDDKKKREIYHTHFIHLAEVRQLRGKNLIFVKIFGTYITRLDEEENENKIFIYNLSTRKLIGWSKY